MPRRKPVEQKSRLNLDLPQKTRERLEQLRVETHADSMTEVVRRALEVYETILKASKTNSLLLRSQDGTERQIFIV